MSNSPKIFYYLEGWEQTMSVRTATQQVRALNARGVSASVLLGPRDRAEPGLEPVPFCRLEGQGICPEDTIITLDGARPPITAKAPGQVGTLIHEPLMVFQNTTAGDWTPPPFSFVLCSSDHAARFADKVLGVKKPFTVPFAVEPSHVPLKKRLAIACTGEKSLETAFVKNAFLRQNAQHADFEWLGADPMSQEEVAHALGEAAIFLHTPSGGISPVSPLDAMACECLVVGFATLETEDYAGPGNGLWCRETDLMECVRLLEPAAALVKAGHRSLETMLDAARETARSRSPRAMEEALVKALRELEII